MASKSEKQLIAEARKAVASCNWVLGECAWEWTELYSKGRTDADFARMIDDDTVTVSKIGDCRRVWADFGKTYGQWPSLTWSHFRAAKRLPLPSIHDALDWANDNESTVSEMLAWTRARFGPDSVAEEPPPPPPKEKPPKPEPAAPYVPEPGERDTPDDADAVHMDDESPPARDTPAPPKAASPVPGPSQSGPPVMPSVAKEASGQTTSQINSVVSQLELAAQVIRDHWPRFNVVQRDRVEAALVMMQRATDTD
jgi:hypothetical protein